VLFVRIVARAVDGVPAGETTPVEVAFAGRTIEFVEFVGDTVGDFICG